jgi:hypothetical protein
VERGGEPDFLPEFSEFFSRRLALTGRLQQLRAQRVHDACPAPPPGSWNLTLRAA